VSSPVKQAAEIQELALQPGREMRGTESVTIFSDT
jgi:hypothetical protein